VVLQNPAAPRPPDENLVIVIDDDEIMRLSCEEILCKSGYRVETFARGHDGIRRLQEVRAPLLIVDIKMPELDGFDVIQIVRKLDPELAIVVITGYATVDTAVDAMKSGAYDFLPKPFTPGELRVIVERGFERWRLIQEAQRLRREKEEAERRFVTLVSHQLKTPLVAVKQYLDALLFSQQGKLPEQAEEWISRSQVRLGEMLMLIQDWLALAKIESGHFCDGTGSTRLSEIIGEVVRSQRQSPAASAVVIDLTIPSDLPAIRGDAASISTVVSNLVSNAIKYNRPGGSVSIRASAGEHQITLEVIDTGIGIPRECLPHLFQEFYRVRTSATQDIPGTGLGLIICNRIVTELGGSIEVQSEEGRGTTMIVRLPRAEAQAAT